MADGTAVVEAADVEVTELKLGDHVARGQTGLAAQLLCSSCAVFHELACHQALTTQLSKAVDRERPLVAGYCQSTPPLSAPAEHRLLRW